MNDRIEKLAEQATGTVSCGLNGTSTVESFNRKKFAELIIREAADIATMNQHQWHCPGTYVLKHFGIDQ